MTTTAPVTNCGIKVIKLHGYRIEFYANVKSLFCGKFTRVLTSGKNKGRDKVLENFRFYSAQDRENWARKKVESILANVKSKTNEKATLDAARASFVNPFKVGQIFYDSWGYDQTNIDFYEVVEVLKRAVKLRKIGQKKVEGSSESWGMSEYVTPDAGNFISAPQTKSVMFRTNSKGEVITYITGYRGSISPYDAGEKGLYQSHYA